MVCNIVSVPYRALGHTQIHCACGFEHRETKGHCRLIRLLCYSQRRDVHIYIPDMKVVQI